MSRNTRASCLDGVRTCAPTGAIPLAWISGCFQPRKYPYGESGQAVAIAYLFKPWNGCLWGRHATQAISYAILACKSSASLCPNPTGTTPRGAGQRLFFLHDGRTGDLLAAIEDHRSPQQRAIRRPRRMRRSIGSAVSHGLTNRLPWIFCGLYSLPCVHLIYSADISEDLGVRAGSRSASIWTPLQCRNYSIFQSTR
jgi:hypothetical protein